MRGTRKEVMKGRELFALLLSCRRSRGQTASESYLGVLLAFFSWGRAPAKRGRRLCRKKKNGARRRCQRPPDVEGKVPSRFLKEGVKSVQRGGATLKGKGGGRDSQESG